MPRIGLVATVLFVTACGHGMQSVFYHDERAIRLDHDNGVETVVLHDIEPETASGRSFDHLHGILQSTPILVYVDHNQTVCPPRNFRNIGGTWGCLTTQPAQAPDEWCDIYAWNTGRAVRLTPGRTRFPLSSGSELDLDDVDEHCYFGVSANSTQSVIAAALTVPVGSSVINGMLVVREGSVWTGYPGIPGWQPLSPKIEATAANHAGTHVAYQLGSEVFLAQVSALPQATKCGDGGLPQFGLLEGDRVLAWYENGRFRVAADNTANCDRVTFSSTPHPVGTIVSWGWSEFGSTAVYILQTATAFDVYEYDFDDDRHSRVLSDARPKSSISIFVN